MRISEKHSALKHVNKAVEYNNMLIEIDFRNTTGVYLFKKISKEVLKQVDELLKLDLSNELRIILDELRTMLSDDSFNGDETSKILVKLKEKISEFSAKYRVLFLPYKYSMWDSLESIHEAAQKDPECEAYVMPIPYYDKDNNGNMTEMHDESDLYPKDLDVVSWREHTVDEINPDIIFIHNPYDDGNLMTSIHPDYYTRKLVRDDRLVVYVPYYVSYTDDPDMMTSLGFAEMYADYVITQSEWYKDKYVKHLNEYRRQGEDIHSIVDYYDNGHKFAVLGNPKYDKVATLAKKSYPLSDGWHDALFCGAGQRLTLLLDTTVELVLKQRENVFEKINAVIDVVEERRDMALIWRPHPLIEVTISDMAPELEETYRRTIERCRNLDNCIFDDTPDMHRAMAWSDCFFGKYGSMLELYRHTGKPAVMLDLGGTDSSVRDYDEGALSGKVHAGEVLREEELGMGTVLEFCREYQYVPADFEQKETFGERIYKFSKEALVRKISK
ncbi:hypothetical protein [Ligilactobacillus ruminis]|uniref:hypothetical protein n=1 Tax=Ligilactobacillus ruminis TaxID=1623 RepID=UPI0022E7C8B4|nr:hypothetical protein [Ligilactobacillus ruminis]